MKTRLWWRGTLLQVHRWIGLLLASLMIPLGLSGAALVWHDALDAAINPGRYATSGAGLLAPGMYATAATARLGPGERVARLSLPTGDGPVTVAAASASGSHGEQPLRTIVYLDPPTARVLDVASSGAGLVRFLHVLHGSLQIPGGWGRSIVGWLGVAMMVSAFTGLWLWWPTVGSIARAFRWKRHSNLDSNIHQTFGFWIALPLFVLSLTGAWISFPQFFGSLIGQGRPPGPDRAQQARARPVATTRLPVGVAIARAEVVARGQMRQVTWPTEQKPDWTVQVKPARGAPVQVSVADDGGVAVLAPVPAGQGGVGQLMRRIHDGTGMGWVWQAVIFLGGILPAGLAVTGVIMWWRARLAGKRKLSGVAKRASAGGL